MDFPLPRQSLEKGQLFSDHVIYAECGKPVIHAMGEPVYPGEHFGCPTHTILNGSEYLPVFFLVHSEFAPAQPEKVIAQASSFPDNREVVFELVRHAGQQHSDEGELPLSKQLLWIPAHQNFTPSSWMRPSSQRPAVCWPPDPLYRRAS
jgi:hypothetical protein